MAFLNSYPQTRQEMAGKIRAEMLDSRLGLGDIGVDVAMESKQKTIQLGMFSIPKAWFISHPEELRGFFGLCLVLQANHSFSDDSIEYVATSPNFKEIPIHARPKRYKVIQTADNGETIITFKHTFDFMQQMKVAPKPNKDPNSLMDSFIKRWLAEGKAHSECGKPVVEMNQNELMSTIGKLNSMLLDKIKDVDRKCAQYETLKSSLHALRSEVNRTIPPDEPSPLAQADGQQSVYTGARGIWPGMFVSDDTSGKVK